MMHFLKKAWDAVQKWVWPYKRAEDAETPKPIFRISKRGNKKKQFYERQRRKFDKFVEPSGPKPTPIKREKKEEKSAQTPKAVSVEEDTVLPIFVDAHHSDRKTDVLYEAAEFWGEFTFRDTILEQLERYFFYLQRMKRRDRQAFELYRRVGANLVPYVKITDLWEGGKYKDDSAYDEEATLQPWFMKNMPSFGCIARGTCPEAERIENDEKVLIPRFMYITKYDMPPPDIQFLRGGVIYSATAWWDRTDKGRKFGSPTDFGILVRPDGTMQALKHLETVMLGKKRDIPQRGWRFPECHKSWAKTHNTTVNKMLCHTFAGIASTLEDCSYRMARVSVKKGDDYALFGIDVSRLPYFFKDRDYVLNENGHRKRILHAVRSHTLSDGTVVPMQFRGARKFTWAGYQVTISIPGKHHPNIEDFDVGAWDNYWTKQSAQKFSPVEKVGTLLREIMDS